MLKKFIPLLVITILTSLFAFTSYCQDLLDVGVGQTPYVYFNHVIAKEKPVQSIIYLVKKYYKNNLIRPDTIYKEYLTKDGERLSYITFKENKAGLPVDYKYSQNKMSVEWIIKDPAEKNRFYFSRNIKSKQGDALVQYQATVANGDTTSRTYTNFFYNSDSLLIKKSVGGSYGTNKLGTSAIIYEYLGKDMILAKSYFDFNNSGSYLATAYKYNIDHLPVEKKAYSVRNGRADTPALFSYFYYDDGLLIKEKYQGYDDKAKVNETTVDYQYNLKKQLVKLNAKVDSVYKNIEYQYDGDKLKKVITKTNTQIRLNREEFIYVDRTIETPFIFEKSFEYDEFGNLIITKELINGEIYREFIKEISYF